MGSLLNMGIKMQLAPPTTTTTTTAAPTTFSIGFGGDFIDACNFSATDTVTGNSSDSDTVTGNSSDFCSSTTFTGSIFAAASTGTWYVSFSGNYVSVFVTNGNSVATVTSSCQGCLGF
jgi:hypothetical protein